MPRPIFVTSLRPHGSIGALALATLAACGDVSTPPAIDAAPPTVDAATDAFVITDNGTTQVTTQQRGNPSWETTGWELLSAPTFQSSVQDLWRLHAYLPEHNAFGPGAVHPPPYDTEISDAATRLGFDPGRIFPRSDWTAPRNLLALGAIVPSATAPQGRTPDYAFGPHLPIDLSLHVDGDLFKDGQLVDPDFDATYPSLFELRPDLIFMVDGSSHLTLTFSEDTSFIPGTPGHYTLRIVVTETNVPANGWTISIDFDIV